MRRSTKSRRRGKPRAPFSLALRRQWRMGILLRRWRTIAQLAETLDVSKATAQRDLDLLSDLFVVSTRVDRRKHRQRRYYRMPGCFVPRARST